MLSIFESNYLHKLQHFLQCSESAIFPGNPDILALIHLDLPGQFFTSPFKGRSWENLLIRRAVKIETMLAIARSSVSF